MTIFGTGFKCRNKVIANEYFFKLRLSSETNPGGILEFFRFISLDRDIVEKNKLLRA